MFPVLLFSALLATVGYVMGGNRRYKPIRTLSAGVTPPEWDTSVRKYQQANVPGYPGGQVPATYPGYPAQPAQQGFVAQLSQLATQGLQPPPQLVQLALAEAMATGDFASAQAIQALFVAAPPMVMAGDVGADGDEPEAILEVGGEPATAESWGESANPGPNQATQAPAEPKPLACPIEGVPYGGWLQFVTALRTKKAAWADPTHLGQFEHNRKRLAQLGLSEADLATPESQYDALCKDVADYLATGTRVLGQVGKQVEVGGSAVQLTRSGALGLLKAAGPKGAEGWLSNPADRTRFPRTTELFMRCNNCF